MSDRSRLVLTEDLALPEAERSELADRLFGSLDPPSDIDRMTEDEFGAALERRAAEMRDDPTSRIPREQVREMR